MKPVVSKCDTNKIPLETLVDKVVSKIREKFVDFEEFICETDSHKYLLDTPDVSVEYKDGRLCLKSVSFRYNYSKRVVADNKGVYTVDNAFGVDHNMNYLLVYDGFENFISL